MKGKDFFFKLPDNVIKIPQKNNLGCLKLTTQKKFNQSKIIIEIYYDSYLFKIKFDLDFHLIDFVFCFMLRVFELGTEDSI